MVVQDVMPTGPLTPFDIEAFAFLAVGATLTHLRTLRDLVHLYFTPLVVRMTPTLAHLPPAVAVGATLTHLRTLRDLVHLYFTPLVVRMMPTLAHLPPAVAASTGTTATSTAPINKSPTRRVKRPISATIST